MCPHLHGRQEEAREEGAPPLHLLGRLEALQDHVQQKEGQELPHVLLVRRRLYGGLPGPQPAGVLLGLGLHGGGGGLLRPEGEVQKSQEEGNLLQPGGHVG